MLIGLDIMSLTEKWPQNEDGESKELPNLKVEKAPAAVSDLESITQ
jgi:hypothetical protein